MFPEPLLLREPLEYPPPDPPFALAKDMVGAMMRDSTMPAAISFFVFKTSFLSIRSIALVKHPPITIIPVVITEKCKIREPA
jgi:hypothetical protein